MLIIKFIIGNEHVNVELRRTQGSGSNSAYKIWGFYHLELFLSIQSHYDHHKNVLSLQPNQQVNCQLCRIKGSVGVEWENDYHKNAISLGTILGTESDHHYYTILSQLNHHWIFVEQDDLVLFLHTRFWIIGTEPICKLRKM